MFEDSTFESSHRIQTRTSRWMAVALALNATLVVALILFPLLYPQSIVRQRLTFLLSAPARPEPTRRAPLEQRVAAQKLIMEHEMGEFFKVIGLTTGAFWDAVGFASGDRTHRL